MQNVSVKGICLILVAATLSACIRRETIQIERREGEITYYAFAPPLYADEAPKWRKERPGIRFVDQGRIPGVIHENESVHRFKTETIQVHRAWGVAVFPVASKGEGR